MISILAHSDFGDLPRWLTWLAGVLLWACIYWKVTLAILAGILAIALGIKWLK